MYPQHVDERWRHLDEGSEGFIEVVRQTLTKNLVDQQRGALGHAPAWTADLAHGLKTPLTVLIADAQRLREEGNTSIADDVGQLAETMRRRIDRELIRARVRSGIQTRGARAEVREAVDRVVRTLKRTPRGAALDWSVDVPDRIDAPILSDELTELLGNILENATKWAKAKIAISVSDNNAIAINVEDDGPGVAEDQLDSLSLRGVRLDEQKQGTGLGLAIARDIAEAYNGNLSLSNRPQGGLAVTVLRPVAT